MCILPAAREPAVCCREGMDCRLCACNQCILQASIADTWKPVLARFKQRETLLLVMVREFLRLRYTLNLKEILPALDRTIPI